jgi:acrylyl-CoA reductase (NADPH)
MTSFEALLVSKTENGQSIEWKSLTEADLMDGDVTIRVTHSTLNYKDGLALTGKAPVIRRWPMIPGVDFAGIVTSSTHPNFKEGDEVFLNGCGLGEMHFGGYSQYARVPGDWLLRVPEGLSRADCMTVGTAGFSSMLAVMALQDHGVTPDDGPVLVTGAGGGVGSVAVVLLAKLGYSVTASSGRMEIADALKALGAKDVVPRSEFSGKPRPLAKERWAGAVDVVGSATLANILSQTQYGGVVAACGLVQGIDLPTSVAPFILRGVTLVGIESVMTPKVKREAAWKRLAQILDVTKLHALIERHPLKDVVQLAPEIVAGRVKGRILFELGEPQKVEVKPQAETVPETVAAEQEVASDVAQAVVAEVVEEPQSAPPVEAGTVEPQEKATTPQTEVSAPEPEAPESDVAEPGTESTSPATEAMQPVTEPELEKTVEAVSQPETEPEPEATVTATEPEMETVEPHTEAPESEDSPEAEVAGAATAQSETVQDEKKDETAPG